jgi:hypothetical protein
MLDRLTLPSLFNLKEMMMGKFSVLFTMVVLFSTSAFAGYTCQVDANEDFAIEVNNNKAAFWDNDSWSELNLEKDVTGVSAKLEYIGLDSFGDSIKVVFDTSEGLIQNHSVSYIENGELVTSELSCSMTSALIFLKSEISVSDVKTVSCSEGADFIEMNLVDKTIKGDFEGYKLSNNVGDLGRDVSDFPQTVEYMPDFFESGFNLIAGVVFSTNRNSFGTYGVILEETIQTSQTLEVIYVEAMTGTSLNKKMSCKFNN